MSPPAPSPHPLGYPSFHKLIRFSTLLFSPRQLHPPRLAPPPPSLIRPKKTTLPPAPLSPLSYEKDPAGLPDDIPPPLPPPKRKRSTSSYYPAPLPAVTEYDDEPPAQSSFLSPLSTLRQTSTITQSTVSDDSTTPWDAPSTARFLTPLPSLSMSHTKPSLSEISIPSFAPDPMHPHFKVHTNPPSSPKIRLFVSGPMSAEDSLHSHRGNMRQRFVHTAARAGRTKWAAAVVCATSRSMHPPSARYVGDILMALREGGCPDDRETPVGAVFDCLRTRLESRTWVVVLKAVIVIHACLRAGDRRFVQWVVQCHPDLLRAHSGNPFGGKEGRKRLPFLIGYREYLEGWMAVRRKCGRVQEVGKVFRRCTSWELIQGLETLVACLEKVKGVEVNDNLTECHLVMAAVALLLRDVKGVLAALKEGFRRLVEEFFGLENRAAVPAMALYARFVRVVGEVRPVLRRLRGGEGSADGIRLEGALLGKMRTYIEKNGGGAGKIMSRNLSVLSYRAPTECEQEEWRKQNSRDEGYVEEDGDEFELERVDVDEFAKKDVVFTETDLSDIDDGESIQFVPVPHVTTPFPSQMSQFAPLGCE